MKHGVLSLVIFTFCFIATQAFAKKAPQQGSLILKGIVPLKSTVTFSQDQQGAVVPTLHSNAPAHTRHLTRLKVSRAPASSEKFQSVTIESP